MQIQTIVFLLFFQSLTACQQGPETKQPQAAGIASHSSQEEAKPISDGGILFRSIDGGQRWQDISVGLPKGLMVWSIFAEGKEVYLGSENGLYHSASTTSAPVWKKDNTLDQKVNQIFPGKSGPFVYRYDVGFFQKTSETGAWEPVDNALQDRRQRAILETQQGILFMGTFSGIYKSTNKGGHWKKVFSDGIINSIVEAEGVLVACSTMGLLRSTDDGEHWEQVLTDEGEGNKIRFIGGQFIAITGGGGPRKSVYTNGSTNTLRTSSDGGKTWRRMDESLGPVKVNYDLFNYNSAIARSSSRGIYDIAAANGTLYCSNDAGIFRSVNQGETWQLVLPSNGQLMFDIAVSGNAVYALIRLGC